ncbi:hypothetical protein M0R45_031676 [Rubus argutus]|uniref:Uncharacterized protein n=1 Tax=Rubus argutus TaxID=59490 RepID=A0AAW1WH57_RUBAR
MKFCSSSFTEIIALITDLRVAESAVGGEIDLEFEAVLLNSGVVWREFEGVVPFGVGVAVLVDWGPELLLLKPLEIETTAYTSILEKRLMSLMSLAEKSLISKGLQSIDED